MTTLTMYFECEYLNENHSKTKQFIMDNAKQCQIDYQIKLCGCEIKFISISYDDHVQIDR